MKRSWLQQRLRRLMRSQLRRIRTTGKKIRSLLHMRKVVNREHSALIGSIRQNLTAGPELSKLQKESIEESIDNLEKLNALRAHVRQMIWRTIRLPLMVVIAIIIIWGTQKTRSTKIRVSLTASTLSMDVHSASDPFGTITAVHSIQVDPSTLHGNAQIDGMESELTALPPEASGVTLTNLEIPAATTLQFESPIAEQLFIRYSLRSDTIPKSVSGYIDNYKAIIVSKTDTLPGSANSVQFTGRVSRNKDFDVLLAGQSQIDIPRLTLSAISFYSMRNHEDSVSNIRHGTIQFLETQDSLVLEEDDDLQLTLENPVSISVSRENGNFNVRFLANVTQIQAGARLMESENNDRMPERYKVIVHQIPSWAWGIILVLLPVLIAYLWPSTRS